MATIRGTNSDDTLYGTEFNDALIGSKGNDYLYGDLGSDTYYFYVGDGQDTVDNYTDEEDSGDVVYTDKIVLGLGISAANTVLQYADDGDSLKLVFNNKDSIILQDYFLIEKANIDRIQFNDGTIWTQATLAAMIPNIVTVFTGTQGDDDLEGSDYKDKLLGLAGGDHLDGGSGDDVLVGGVGNDMLIGGLGNDTYQFNLGDGQDTIDNQDDEKELSISHSVDTLVLGTGISTTNTTVHFSDDGTSLILGFNQTDSILLQDFWVDEASKIDQVIFNDGHTWSFIDLIQQAYQLSISGIAANKWGATSEDVIGADVANSFMVGETGNDQLTGSVGNDILVGGVGNDSLYGAMGDDILIGGVGDDVLSGGYGKNTYDFFVGDGNDIIQSQLGSTETIKWLNSDSSQVDASYVYFYDQLTKMYSANIVFYYGDSDSVAIKALNSNLSLQFSDGEQWSWSDLVAHLDMGSFLGTSANDKIEGGLLNDSIFSGAGNDTLDGGQGIDTLVGSKGSDTYYVDNQNDVVVENANEGNDRVYASVSYTLPENVESLYLSGVNNINATGNKSNNLILGNEGDNVLDGGGGADTLVGGRGNDTYYVDDVRDSIVELANQGANDVVNSVVSYSLSANVEKLNLLGNANIDAVGNELANTIVGNSGNNKITGGRGNDILIGGTGNDVYVFNRGDGADIIRDIDATPNNQDVLSFGDSINYDQLWLKRSGYSLEVSVLGTTDKVLIQNWYQSPINKIEQITVANGMTLLASQVDRLVTAMATMAIPNGISLSTAQHQVLDPVLTMSWSHH